MVHHRALNSEIVLDILCCDHVECVRVELNRGVLLFFRFLYLKLLLLRLGRLDIHFLSISLFGLLLFLFILLLGLLLRYLCLLSPLFRQMTILKCDKPMFIVFQFECDCINFFFWILSLSNVVSDVLIESIYKGLVFNQNLYRLFSSEFDSLASWYLTSLWKNCIWLFLRVKRTVQSKILVSLNEIPVKLNGIVAFLN